MANEVLTKQGTTIEWLSSGGDYGLVMSSLANGAGRQGESGDFGEKFPARVRIGVEFDFDAAPTAGTTVDCYWSSSHDNANFDGECTGSEGAYDSEADMARLYYVGSLVASNDTDPQRTSWPFYLPARYGLPVISNQSGQALTATAADQKVIVTPLIDEIQ